MYLTFHLLHALPMHNLNRGSDGLPKSQFDGGVQRARLSSQSLKRPARLAFRETVANGGSLRTKNAAAVVTQIAQEWATDRGLAFDPKAGKQAAKKVIDALAKAEKADRGDAASETGATELDAKDNILLFAQAELETLARAIVEKQQAGDAPTAADFDLDFRSPALDIAAFGRMFASRADLSTQAAVAVSHAVTTHPMSLTVDYFTAVDDAPSEGRVDAGAGFLSLAYFTSGVYYRTFTIDPAQLRRSWSGFDAPSAPNEFGTLVRTLVKALPTGRLTNSNAHTQPFVLLAEEQRSRVAYEFETPVEPDEQGGYKAPSARRLAAERAAALAFDPANFGDAVVLASSPAIDFSAEEVHTLDDIVAFAVKKVFAQ